MNKTFKLTAAVLLMLVALSACAPAASLAAVPVSAAVVKPEEQQMNTSVQPAQTQPISDKRQITVSGTGKVFLVPDVAYIYIGVNSQSANVADALAKNNEQALAVTKAIKEMGVDQKDIQTSSFNIYPQNQYDPNGKITSTTYSVDNVVYVTVRDLTKVGKLLDTVVRSGANSINGINFDVLEKAKAESEARKLAVENARIQADEMAQALGAKLGPAMSVVINGEVPAMPNYSAYGLGGGAMAASNQVPVSAGQLLLSMSVTVTYEMQ